MHWITEIEEERANRVQKRVWGFIIYDGLKVYLNSIIDLERTTLRHKYKRVNSWLRIDKQNSTMERIDPPEHIIRKVKERINNSLEFY